MANDTTKLHRHRRAAEPQRLPPGARGHRGHHPLAFCEGHGGASSGCNEGYSDLITKLGTLEDCKGAWMLFDMRDFCGLAPDGIICVPRMRTIGKETRAELEDSATSQGGRCWSEPNEVIVRVLRGSQPAHWTGIVSVTSTPVSPALVYPSTLLATEFRWIYGPSPVVLVKLDFRDTQWHLSSRNWTHFTNVAIVPWARHTSSDLQQLPSRSVKVYELHAGRTAAGRQRTG